MKNNKSKKTLFEKLNSPISLLAMGFLLTTLAGSYINNSYHEKSWRSKARFEIFKERLKEASETQDSILSLSNRRIFLLRRVYFELLENRLQSARDIWKEYFKVTQEWNNDVKTNKNRLSLLFGNDVGASFLADNENQIDNPKSLHHVFRKAHYAVLEVIECMKKGCNESEKQELLSHAEKRMNSLGLAHDKFSMQLRTSLRQKEIVLLE